MSDALDGDLTRSRAVLIGTWDYTELQPIPAARTSLHRMRSLLTGQLCRWPDENVTVVDNPRKLDELPDLLASSFHEAKDVALFYFVGHGQQDADDELCLALGETTSVAHRRRTTSLRYSHVRDAFRSSQARTKIAVLDCCFAGLAVHRNGSLATEVKIPPAPGAYLMMATGPFNTAWFQLGAESDSPETFFTKAIVDVIEAGIPTSGRGLTLDDIFRAAADRLVNDGKPQPDQLSAGFSNPFYFARNTTPSSSPQPSVLNYPAPRPTPDLPDETPRLSALRRSIRLRLSRRQLSSFTAAAARERALSHGIVFAPSDAPGIRLGTTVQGKSAVYASYLETQLWICGTRRGTTSSMAIPTVVDAPGPVLLTSTKGDEVALTRDVRTERGSPVFVFDPHSLVSERPNWYWDPLAWVNIHHVGAESRAGRLAAHFANCADGVDATATASDADATTELITILLLAAAAARRSIVDVLDWLSSPHDDTPIVALRNAGIHRAATILTRHYNSDYRERDRVIDAAMRMVRCLAIPEFQPWVTPGETRTQFDELEFLNRNATLFALSSSGRGTAAPLLSAMVEAVLDVAARKASRCSGGVLPIPLMAVLDDAPQLLRWREFPRVYSGLGNKGIVAIAMMRAWNHGVLAWGTEGMADMWSCADFRAVGGGLSDIEFARARLEALGYPASPPPSSGFGRALGRQRTTFSVSDLLALPLGQIVLMPQFGPPILLRTPHWSEGPYRDAIIRSADCHNPRRKTPITDLLGDPSS
ncbi:caspase family protein [Nocardia salmonicida]|uniref:caspase, EACC1-associated type n=1 Tax=Nocardia salmonicida TaxID=53431 RepID=UPI00371EA6BF